VSCPEHATDGRHGSPLRHRGRVGTGIRPSSASNRPGEGYPRGKRHARPASLRPITIDAAVAGAFFVATLAGALVEGIDPSEGVIGRLDAPRVPLTGGGTPARG